MRDARPDQGPATNGVGEGAHDDLLAALFSSKVRAAVLGFLLPRPHLGFSLTDLSRRLGLPISSLQHECYKLERIGVLTARRSGNTRRYRVEPGCPLHAALTALIVHAIGPAACLAGAIEAIEGLELAFLSEREPERDGNRGAGRIDPGVATRAAPPPRLVLVGDVPLEVLDGAAARVERALGLPRGALDFAFFQPGDWQARIATLNPYTMGLLAGRFLDLLPSRDPRAATLATVERR